MGRGLGLNKKPHPRILDSLKEQIMEWIEEELTGVRIFEKLQKQGLKAGYSTVKDYLAQIKRRKIIYPSNPDRK